MTVPHEPDQELIKKLEKLQTAGTAFEWEGTTISRMGPSWIFTIDNSESRFISPKVFRVVHFERGVVLDGELVQQPKLIGSTYLPTEGNVQHVEDGELIWSAR